MLLGSSISKSPELRSRRHSGKSKSTEMENKNYQYFKVSTFFILGDSQLYEACFNT